MSNLLKVLSQLNESNKSFVCSSFFNAKEKLEQENVKYDLIYKLQYKTSDRYGAEKVTQGVHYYFNDGKNKNVAAFEPNTESLTINTRKDDTPEDKRIYVK